MATAANQFSVFRIERTICGYASPRRPMAAGDDRRDRSRDGCRRFFASLCVVRLKNETELFSKFQLNAQAFAAQLGHEWVWR
ncbi:MAG: hypothetical protein K2P80_02275 [Beijerinckiaceae bacterium]|nr:hypothetical protein [Beijerinckiaceae bacterium]